MPTVEGPAARLARRLRALRTSHWPELHITQAQLAAALAGSGKLSVPSISSWEKPANPALPPVDRLAAYATFFATARSVEHRPYRLLDLAELTADESAERERLLTELTGLHEAAKSGAPASSSTLAKDSVLRFPPGENIVLVCARLPAELRETMPEPDPASPDHIDLYDFADIDALMELYGRLSALNPDSLIQRVLPDNLTPDHYRRHLIVLGGVDWNPAIRDLIERTSAPIRQLPRDDETSELGGFEVDDAVGAANESPTFEPQLLDIDGQSQVAEDVAQIYYGPNPYFPGRTVMSFNGQFTRGTLGAVRALTDPQLRDQNETYLREQFGDELEWSLLTKVVIVEGQPITPAWSFDETRLYEWSASQGSRG